jgi:hypothetical protein
MYALIVQTVLNLRHRGPFLTTSEQDFYRLQQLCSTSSFPGLRAACSSIRPHPSKAPSEDSQVQ